MGETDKYYKRRKRSTLISACEVLHNLLQKSKTPLSDQFLRWKLYQQWGDVVGPTLGTQCLPVGFDRGTLLLWVEHSVYIQQLNFLSSEIVSKVNDYVGRQWVQRIRFTLNKQEEEP